MNAPRNRVEIRLTPRLMRDLHTLQRYGLWGSTPAKVARNLMIMRIQDLVAAKILPVEYKDDPPK